jgi:WD40 repeat protein
MAYRACIVGDDLGVLRRVEVPASRTWNDAAVRDREGEMDKASAVRCMAMQPKLDRPNLAVGRTNGLTSVHDGISLSRLVSLKASKPDDTVAAVSWIPRTSLLFVGYGSGTVTAFAESEQAGTSNDETWREKCCWKCGNSIHCCDVHPQGQRFAVGGEDREVSIYDCSSGMMTTLGDELKTAFDLYTHTFNASARLGLLLQVFHNSKKRCHLCAYPYCPRTQGSLFGEPVTDVAQQPSDSI